MICSGVLQAVAMAQAALLANVGLLPVTSERCRDS
jgi:hypothetical protein